MAEHPQIPRRTVLRGAAAVAGALLLQPVLAPPAAARPTPSGGAAPDAALATAPSYAALLGVL